MCVGQLIQYLPGRGAARLCVGLAVMLVGCSDRGPVSVGPDALAQIAYSGHVDYLRAGVYLVDTLGFRVRKLTDYASATSDPIDLQTDGFEWFPDGNRLLIVYGPEDLYPAWAVGFVDVTTGDLTRLENGVTNADLSPNGANIAVDYQGGMRLLASDGTWRRDLLAAGSGVARPRWSPNGQQLLALIHGDPFLVDPETGDTLRLLDTPNYALCAEWSPDGNEIAVCYGRGLDELGGLYRIAPTGGTLERMIAAEDLGAYHVFQLAWSEYGIAFHANQGPPDTRLYYLAPGSEMPVLVSSAANANPPAWFPDSPILAFAKDGAIHLYDTNSGQIRRVPNRTDVTIVGRLAVRPLGGD